MRNVFDQYEQLENRLTHALLSTLHEGRDSMLKPFLSKFAQSPDAIARLQITEQTMPGRRQAITVANTDKASSIPDGCIQDDGSWILLIESKVQASLNLRQLFNHVAGARQAGFDDIKLLVIVLDRARIKPSIFHKLEQNAVKDRFEFHVHEWRELYGWFNTKKSSAWACRFTHYLETIEARYSLNKNKSIEGTLTMFTGIPFDSAASYEYLEAKRQLRLLREALAEKLAKSALPVQKAGGRGMIPGSTGGNVWDYFLHRNHPSKKSGEIQPHTAYPHFTFAITRDWVHTALIFPNGYSGKLKRQLNQIKKVGFLSVLEEILAKSSTIGHDCRIQAEVIQRHWVHRRLDIQDAKIWADLRTLHGGNGVKRVPHWVNAMYEALTEKWEKGEVPNLQFYIQFVIPHSSRLSKTPKVVDVLVLGWEAMMPALDEFILS